MNAYLMRFTKKVSDKESWMKDYTVYIPILRQMASVLSSAISNMVFPSDDNYIKIEGDDLVGRFWTELILLNFHKTAWIQNADRGILQSTVLGNNWLAIQPRGQWIEAIPFGVDTMVCAPLSDDLSNSTKISMLRKRLDELVSSDFQYFNLEKIAETQSRFTSRDETTQVNKSQKEHNILDRGEKVTLGEGYLLYQAFIHHYRFKDGTEIKNYVATYTHEPRTLIRFEPQMPGFDPFVLTKYGTILPNQFWAQGPIELGLSISNYLNTLMMISLVSDVLDAIGVYVYNENDDILHSKVQRNELIVAPNRLWGAGDVNSIQPLQRASKTGNVKELFYVLKNELIDLVNAHIFVTGNTPDGRPDPTATFTNARQNGASMRVSSIGKIFDEGMIKPVVYRVVQLLQKTFMQQGQILNPATGQPVDIQNPNLEVIAQRLEQIGWDVNTIYEPGFLDGIMKPVQFNEIKVTGTEALVKKLQAQDNMTFVVDRIGQYPMFQEVIRPDKLLTKYLEVNDIDNIDEIVINSAEQIQELEGMLQQIDQVLADPNGINPQTGEVLTEDELNNLLMDKQEIETRLSSLRFSEGQDQQQGMMEVQQAMQPQPVNPETEGVGPTEIQGPANIT
jgi:hypothetical protein